MLRYPVDVEHAEYHIVRAPPRKASNVSTRLDCHPIIVHPSHGVFEPAASFIRELARWRSETAGTLLDIAYIICAWCNYLQNRGCAWNEASENEYHLWLRNGFAKGHFSRERQARLANVIMRWAHFLGSRDIGGPLVRSFAASISASPLNVIELNPKARFKTQRGPRLKAGKRAVPSPDDVARVLDALASASDPFIAERDWLLGRVAYETGFRAMGLASISCAMIDQMLLEDEIVSRHDQVELLSLDRGAKARIRVKIDELRAAGRTVLFSRIAEKRGRHRVVQFPLSLVLALLEHIWGERAAFIRRKRPGARTKGLLWLSANTGRPLDRTSIKDILRKRGFLKADLKGSGHSLRAAFLTEYAIQLFCHAKRQFGSKYDIRSILTLLAEVAGHEDPMTLKHYLDEAQIRAALVGQTAFLEGSLRSNVRERRRNDVQTDLTTEPVVVDQANSETARAC